MSVKTIQVKIAEVRAKLRAKLQAWKIKFEQKVL